MNTEELRRRRFKLKKTCALILAAGEGKRMGGRRPKVLCEVLFEPMLGWVLRSCAQAGIADCCVVVGRNKEAVISYLGGQTQVAEQTEQKGTGHAVLSAKAFLEEHKDADVVVLCGDAPFMDAKTLSDALKVHRKEDASLTMVTTRVKNPTGYGRILRENGALLGIVEEKDASADQKRITEINSGAYWFRAQDLLSAVQRLSPENEQGEYYLTDAVRTLLSDGKRVVTVEAIYPYVAMGANTPTDLYQLNEIAARAIIGTHMKNGVEFIAKDGILISPTVQIGKGTRILPGVILRGNTVIGENCVIGPNALIEDGIIGDHTVVNATQIYQSRVENNVKIGPYCHIRPGSVIQHDVKIGDFVETKNSVIGPGTAISHLTYVGDSDIGKNVNIGCGVVTVNYDGVKKNRCTIEDGAFIGCNTNLIAPVTVGENGYTAAGSTITRDVPSEALGITRSKQRIIKGFSLKKLAGRKKKVD